MPENGEKFFRLMRRMTNLLGSGQKSTQLSHVFYSVLGLGSTDYSKYQAIPRFIDQKLGQLGATKFYYRAEADDATGLEAEVEPWLEGLQPAVDKCLKQIRSMPDAELAELMKESALQTEAD